MIKGFLGFNGLRLGRFQVGRNTGRYQRGLTHLTTVLLIVLMGTMWSSCFIFRQPTPQPPISTETNEDEQPTPLAEVTPPTPTEITPPTPEEATPPTPEEQKEFNIAILLPFNVQMNSLDFSNDTIHPKSQMAIDYYEGIMIAMDEIKKTNGLNINAFVYDTENNSTKVTGILKQSHMKDMDLILGPVYNKSLKIASEFARKNKIHLISPLSPNAKFVNDNPYFLNANPSVKTHCEKTIDYIIENKYKNVLVVSRNLPNELKLADEFLKLAASSKMNGIEANGTVVQQLIYDEQEDEILKSYLSEFDETVIVVSSLNEFFSTNMMRRFYDFKERYEIVVFGMPNWGKFKNINFDYFEGLNIHYTSNFHRAENDTDSEHFELMYLARAATLPSDYACKGYDMMKYCGQLLKSHKGDPENIRREITKPCDKTFSTYQFFPVFNDSASIEYYENQQLYMLEFNNFEMKKCETGTFKR